MQTLLAFVNFKLYHSINVKYPPILDPRLEALAAGKISSFPFHFNFYKLLTKFSYFLQISMHYLGTSITEPPRHSQQLLASLNLM